MRATIRIVARFHGNESKMLQTENWLRYIGMDIRRTYRPLGIVTGDIPVDRLRYVDMLGNLQFKDMVTPYRYEGELPLSEDDLMDLGEHKLIINRVFDMQ